MSANCTNSYDNRETCTDSLPSSCIPNTGYVSSLIEDDLPECRPNLNDILKGIQLLLERITDKLGDNTTLTADCLDINPVTASQKDWNEQFKIEICALKAAVAALPADIDPTEIMVAIDMLCLLDPACTPQTEYSLQAILVMLVTNYCNLLARVVVIEETLNI